MVVAEDALAADKGALVEFERLGHLTHVEQFDGQVCCREQRIRITGGACVAPWPGPRRADVRP
jgi:hypothetical protein